MIVLYPGRYTLWNAHVAVVLTCGCWQARPHLKIPGRRELVAIGSTFGPATVLYAAKTAAYLLIQATAASLSTIALAAHQPVWSVWGLVSNLHLCPAGSVVLSDKNDM